MRQEKEFNMNNKNEDDIIWNARNRGGVMTKGKE